MEEINLEHRDVKPNQLDFLRVLNNRKPQQFAQHQNLFNRLCAGEEGEREAIRLLSENGRSHWRFIRNYWSDQNGTCESDLIVFTSNGCHNLEVKNYKGVFEYKEGISTIDGVEINSDCVFQARRAFKNLRKMLSPHIGFKNVKGALVFVGESNEVKIHSAVEDIQVVQRNQLVRFILKIAEEEDANRYQQIDWEPVFSKLAQAQCANPFHMDPLSAEEIKTVRKGIMCGDCCSFDVAATRKFLTCKRCGHKELRDRAMVRTICEYGVLRYDQELRRKDLLDFFNGQASKRYLTDILTAHFERVSNGKYTYYRNNRWL